MGDTLFVLLFMGLKC